MINRDDVFQIGRILRPHGLKGEMSFSFSSDIFDEALENMEDPHLICEMDGILVPFFVDDYRFKNDDICLLKLNGVDDDETAKKFTKVPLYIEKEYLHEDVSGAEVEGGDYYVGFHIFDENGKDIGEVEAIDNSTENVLFIVSSPQKEELYIPAVDDYIIGIDDDKKIIQMNIPAGLLDMNSLTAVEDEN